MALDMYIKIGDIKGESIDDKHKEWIDMLAWSWGASNSGTTHDGSGGGGGRSNVQDLSFTKYLDKASPVLLGATCVGTDYPEVNIELRKAGGKDPLVYLTVKLEDVIVTSFSTGGSGGEDRLTENVTLNFRKFTMTYQQQDKSGAKVGGPIPTTYDMAAHKNA